MNLKIANIKDLKVLTHMNNLLRLEETMDNSLTEDEVKRRMETFITGEEYSVFLLFDNDTLVGYAVTRNNSNPLYIRQLYIKEGSRNKGLGKKALNKFLDYFNISEIDIEVMSWNEKAIDFYKKFGFKDRYIGMRYRHGWKKLFSSQNIVPLVNINLSERKK